MEESITAAASGLKIVKNNSSSWSSEGLFLNYSEDAPINPTNNGQTVMQLQPQPQPQYQTISLPSNITLAPGTVLTLQNGQLLRIESGVDQPQTVTDNNVDDGDNSVTIVKFDQENESLLYPKEVELSKTSVRSDVKTKFEKPDDPLLKCDTCAVVFDTWAEFKKHMKKHDLERKFKCNECGASFNVEKNFRLHKASHQVGDVLQCSECDKTFKRVASLKCHLAIHKEEDNLACSECGEEFETEKLLARHRKHKHFGETETIGRHRAGGKLDSYNGEKLTEDLNASLQCKICYKSFETKKEILEHQLKHKKLKNSLELIKKRSKGAPKDGKLKCKFCSKKFFKPSQVERHERIHTGVRPYKCQECGKAFTQKQSLESHSLKHSGQKPYACSFCAMKFSQRGNLRAHILRVHNITDENKYHCSYCTCSFKKLGSLNAHTSRFHPEENMLQVPLDPDTIDDDPDPEQEPDDLLSKAIHSTISTLQTAGDEDQENQGSGNNSEYKQFYLADRSVTENDPENKSRHLVKCRTTDGVRYYICNFCPREFKKPSDLIRHIRTHTLEKPFKCEQCDKAFTLKSTLLTHMKVHATKSDKQEPPCDKCGKIFHSHAAYRAHLKAHDNPLPCEQCSETFLTIGTLNEHRQNVHKFPQKLKKDVNEYSYVKLAEPLVLTNEGLMQNVPRHSSVYHPSETELSERQYHCTFCSAVFKKSSHLVQHTRSHTGERPFICYKCSKTFVSRGSLNSHLQTHEDKRTQYQCSLCDMVFTTAGSVRRHMAVHQVERPFLCPYCEKTFKTNVNCKKHMKTHIGSLTAQNPIGKYPPDVIIENPANLHSETVTTDVPPETNQHVQSNLGDSAASILPQQQFYITDVQNNSKGIKDVPQNSSNSQLPRMFTADASGTITLESTTKVAEDVPQDNILLDKDIVLTSQVQDLVTADDMVSLQVNTTDLGLVMNQLTIKLDETNNVTTSDTEKMSTNNKPVISTTSTSINTSTRFDSSTLRDPLRKRTGTHVKLSEEQTRALAATPLEMAKTESEKMLVTSALEKVKGEKEVDGDGAKKKEVHLNQCDQCDYSFKKPSDLIRHIRTHTGERPYSCDICEKKFTVKSTLKTHMKTHTGSKNLVCHVCQSMFSSKTSLKVHMRLHTGALPYKCDFCDKRFRTPANRKTHIGSAHMKKNEVSAEPTTSNEVKQYEEEMVPLTISAESLAAALEQVSTAGAPLVGATVQLQLHGHGFESAMTQLHIDEDLLAQLQKGENINITISKGQLNTDGVEAREAVVEERKRQDNDQIQMQKSDIFISQLPDNQIVIQEENINENVDHKQIVMTVKQQGQQSLLLSKTNDVQTTQISEPRGESSSILIVPDADTDNDQLLSGIQVEAEYPEVGDRDPQLSSLMDRVDLSHLSQVYICPWCDSVFRSEKERKDHLLSIHGIEVKEDNQPTETVNEANTDAKQKVCGFCNKKFHKPSQLVRHMRVHTGERPFACLMCRKSFNQKNALQVHMKKHTGERPHVCPYCQYAFTQKGNLKTHIQRSHNSTEIVT